MFSDLPQMTKEKFAKNNFQQPGDYQDQWLEMKKMLQCKSTMNKNRDKNIQCVSIEIFYFCHFEHSGVTFQTVPTGDEDQLFFIFFLRNWLLIAIA